MAKLRCGYIEKRNKGEGRRFVGTCKKARGYGKTVFLEENGYDDAVDDGQEELRNN